MNKPYDVTSQSHIAAILTEVELVEFRIAMTENIRFKNRRPIGIKFKQKYKSFENILRSFFKPGSFTLLSRSESDIRKAEKIKKTLNNDVGFIYVDRDIRKTLGLKLEKPKQVCYDVILITKDNPPTVLTVVEQDETDKTADRYNKRLSGNLVLSMLHFTDKNITTLGLVMKLSVLERKGEFKKQLDEMRKMEGKSRTSDEMYMDDRKRDEAIKAFVAVLAFSSDGSCLESTSEEERELCSKSLEDFRKEFHCDPSSVSSLSTCTQMTTQKSSRIPEKRDVSSDQSFPSHTADPQRFIFRNELTV